MKLVVTRTDVIDVEPLSDHPRGQASAAKQLAAFRAAFTKSIFDGTAGLTFETSDGDWRYTYVDHVTVQVGFVPADPPAGKDQEP